MAKSMGSSAPGSVTSSADIEDIKQDIDEQKRGIEDANARIDSLEEVVKGSLTPMVESIRKFSHAVKGAKGDAAMQGPAGPPQPEQVIEPMPPAQMAPQDPPPITLPPEATASRASSHAKAAKKKAD
jgi:hypothetical protein